jgi:tRNA dimethylallyltransferase
MTVLMTPPMTAPPPPGNPETNPNTQPWALIIAGPTASGKSALALDLAQRLNGTIINADSMQIYAELRILTARPTSEEEHSTPHALYGIRPAAQPGSAAWWRQTALSEMAKAHAAARLPILCGGTGLYFQSLIQGLADIPDPGEAARQEARTLLATEGPESLHARLTQADPATAARLKPTDAQRLARAWEVYRGTGQGLTAWQARGNQNPAPWRFKSILLDPPRCALRPAIEARFEAMLAQGALDEVRALLQQNLNTALPAMRAHGVPELSRYLAGAITLAEAQTQACLATAQYTKRQATWFRHHALAPKPYARTLLARYPQAEQFSERNMADMQNFILTRVDAPASAP